MEIRKDIIGREGFYQVSNLGNVRSMDRTIKYINGKVCRYKSRPITKDTTHLGYLTVTLNRNNKPKIYKIHRLVAIMFIKNPLNKEQVNHIDGDRENNHIDNLEWCTCSENHRHSFAMLGRISSSQGKKGILSHSSKQIQQIDDNNNIIKVRGSMREIERCLGIYSSSMSLYCNGGYKSDKLNGYKWKII